MTRVILFASTGEEAYRIADFCRRAFTEVQVYHSEWGVSMPEEAMSWEGDYIISYCSRWVIPQSLISRAKQAFNFHPAPPEYPGTGGLNWAIYENQKFFGVTYHKMVADVDAGEIYEARRFPILPNDDAPELFRRTHIHLEALACDQIAKLSLGEFPHILDETWGTKRYRRELDEMMFVNQNIDPDELSRRIRAFEFGKWKLRVKINEHEFLRET